MANEMSEGLDAIPFYGVIKRLHKFIVDPSIHDIAISQNGLKYSIKDFLESLLLIGTTIDLLCFLFTDIIKLDLGNMLSSIRFAFIIGLSELVRVAVFFGVLLSLLLLTKRGWRHLNLARQALRSFAVVNFFLVPGFLLGFNNKIYATISGTPPSQSKYLIAFLILFIGVVLSVWVLVIPVWKYFHRHFNSYVCGLFLFLAFGAAIGADNFAPSPSPTLAINKQSFCEQYVKIRYGSQIESGRYNYFGVLDKCLRAYDNLI